MGISLYQQSDLTTINKTKLKDTFREGKGAQEKKAVGAQERAVGALAPTSTHVATPLRSLAGIQVSKPFQVPLGVLRRQEALLL